jgi:hypothetical protein
MKFSVEFQRDGSWLGFNIYNEKTLKSVISSWCTNACHDIYGIRIYNEHNGFKHLIIEGISNGRPGRMDPEYFLSAIREYVPPDPYSKQIKPTLEI